MSKLDTNIIDNIKMLCLDMMGEDKYEYKSLNLAMAPVFYNLYASHLRHLSNKPNWINRDRVIVTNKLLPLMYSTLYMFGYDITLDNLKEYKKFNSNTTGFSNPNTIGIEMGSLSNGDVLASSVGIALGERYIESLIKLDNPKCNFINYHTYCICTIDDLMNGISYEALSFAMTQKLNKLIILCNIDDYSKDGSLDVVFKEKLTDRFSLLDFEVIEVKNSDNYSSVDSSIDEAKDSKKPTIILFKTTKVKNIEKNDNEYIIDEVLRQELLNNVEKRMNKYLNKWNATLIEYANDEKIKEIVEFLDTKSLKIDFNSENYKLNDNYNEELIKGNSKMFNIFASKNPFILSCSADNFTSTLCNIGKSDNMSKDNPLGRNILFGNRTLAMGGIANGLASLGFKVFLSAPLIDANLLMPAIKLSAMFDYPVNYIFTQDSILNPYNNLGIHPVSELNSLRIIPNLITFRPCDINEIIGTYEILASYKKASVIVIGSEKLPKLSGTNPKYVMAGAYRVKREKETANGIIIASGSEVNLAITISEELLPYGIDLRVVSMPSEELFNSQNERYKYMLLPNSLKTFVIELGSTKLWQKYATNEDYIFGIDKYSANGTKEELLNHYKLNKDSIKTKIIELMKN